MRKKNNKIKKFIVDNISDHPRDISLFTAKKLKINRRTVIDYLHELIQQGELSSEGNTRARKYVRGIKTTKSWEIQITPKTAEDEVWRSLIRPMLGGIPSNVQRIWQHGFTEMLNNVIDHSESDRATIFFHRNAAGIQMNIRDNGIGIFERIRRAFGYSPEETLLELQKGKLTSDPSRHSGEGIFFTSKIFDGFRIRSRGYEFAAGAGWNGEFSPQDDAASGKTGTTVTLILGNLSERKIEDVFGEFASEDDYQFVRTRIPLIAAKEKGEELVSRSQAKRVMARTEEFKEVILDFAGISSIGQGFADEIFRVFANAHPGIKIAVESAGADVAKMIAHAARNPNEAA